MRQLVVEKVWERDFDLRARRHSLILFICGLYVCAAVAGILIPMLFDQPFTYSLGQQLAAAFLIIGSGIAASWKSLELYAAHLLVFSLFVLFAGASFLSFGVNSSLAVLLPLVPAVAGLLIGTRGCAVYMGMVLLALLLLLLVSSDLSSVNSGSDETSHALMLGFATIFVTTVTVYVITLNERLAKALKSKGGFDEVTNLPNRFFIRDWLNQTLSQEKGSNRNLIVLGIGIDNFQEYNEKKGNQRGDEAMAHTAAALQEVLTGHNGVLARNRGNSFIATVVDMDFEDSRALAEKVLAAVSALKLSGANAPYLSVSVGIVCYKLSSDSQSAFQLMELATAELQVAQSLGAAQISSSTTVDADAA